MRISFRYPDTKNGHDITIRTMPFTGIKSMMVGDLPAERLTATIYQYVDPKTEKRHKVELIQEMLGNPQVVIDGRPFPLFLPVAMYEKVIIFASLLGTIVAGIPGLLTSLFFIKLSLGVTRAVANRVLRVIFLVILSLFSIFIGIFLSTILTPIYNDLFNISTSSSSIISQ